jgi:amphi-Trp domain-containing protein
MSDLELKRKESLAKAEVARRLAAFAKALASGDDVELELGGTSMSLRVPDDVRVEFEVEVDGDEIEIEIELKWSTSSATGPAAPASGESGAEVKDAAGRANGKRSRRA